MENIIFCTKPTDTARQVEDQIKRLCAELELSLPYRLIVAIGGDGTMLHAIKKYRDNDTAFVGISAGRLGFLQTVEPGQIKDLLQALKNKTYSTIDAPLLTAIETGSGKVLGYAFNDITIERNSPQASHFNIMINDAEGTFIGDGVIFSTPLGSTAYNLAAGGPIIDSRAEDIYVITPNNPHISLLYSSLQRPHVMDRSRNVKVHVKPEHAQKRPSQLVIDGEGVLGSISDITIALSPGKVKLLQLDHDNFHSRIDAKRLGRH